MENPNTPTNTSSPIVTNVTPPSPKQKSNKILLIIMAVVIVALLGIVAYQYLSKNKSGTSGTTTKSTPNNSSTKSYSVDLSADAISSKAKVSTDNTVQILTINDLSDTFSEKYLTIKEWGLKISTKYADILEYQYIKRGSNWKAGETPYAACNGSYLFCDSVVVIRIKEQYIDLEKEAKKLPYGYTAKDTAEEYKPGLRTIANIYQDNRSLSQGGETKARYWDGKTLLFEQTSQSGIDDLGNSQCGVETTLVFDTKTPCEDMFLSLYRFNASKI